MENRDTYKTILFPSAEAVFKDKSSKFFGYAFPVNNEEQIKSFIEKVKKEHNSARHWCYAWKLGAKEIKYRVNDDGEPNNSAGKPIYGQILSFDVTNILIVVVRYFGGVKLGIGGLINAYRSSAQITLTNSKIIEKTIDINYTLTFDYVNMNKVMRIIKEKNLNINDQSLEIKCEIGISVRKKDAKNIFNIFNSAQGIYIKKL